MIRPCKDDVLLAQAGDRGAAERVVASCRGMIYRLAARRRRGELDDLMQEGAIGLLNAIRTYDPAGCAFTTWAWWKIRAAIANAARRLPKPAAPLSSEAEEVEEPAPHEPSGVLHDLVALLPRRVRRIVLLHFVDGWSYSRIARRYRITKQRIGQIMGEALAVMRQGALTLEISER